MINIIAAVSSNGIIGSDGKLPFKYKSDMKFFREETKNSIVIMGRKTFNEIGSPLKNRENYIISSTMKSDSGYSVFPTLESSIKSAEENTNKDIYLIGGASIYEEGMDFAHRIYLTVVPDIVKGNNLTRFPWINPSKFELHSNITIQSENEPALNVFVYYKK
jgi:dihydrofolate reductase